MVVGGSELGVGSSKLGATNLSSASSPARETELVHGSHETRDIITYPRETLASLESIESNTDTVRNEAFASLWGDNAQLGLRRAHFEFYTAFLYLMYADAKTYGSIICWQIGIPPLNLSGGSGRSPSQ